MSIAYLATLVTSLAFVAVLQNPGPPSRHDLTAKFDTSTGLLLVPVSVNASTVWCSLDTGFSALFTLDERLIQRAGLVPGPAGPTPDGRPPTPGDREARATVDVGGVVLHDQRIILRAFPPEAPDMQCVFGTGLLRDFVVEFDHDAPRVRLYPRDQFVPGRAATVPLTVRRNTAFVDVELHLADGSVQQASMVVDTGASYFSAVLVPAFVERSRMLTFSRHARQPSAGRLRPVAARLPALRVGSWTVPAQVAALLETSIGPGMDDGLLGSGFLQQFTMAIDLAGGRMYLTPNKRFGAPQPFDASGVAFRQTTDQSGYEVAVVIADTPASRANLRDGDRLIRINGMSVDRLTPIELRDMLSRAGVTVSLELMRGNDDVTAILQLDQRL
jgi:hypothetical protein